MRKVVFKDRQGGKVIKRYDTAKTPFQRLIEKSMLNNDVKTVLLKQYQTLNPLAIHRKLEDLLAGGADAFSNSEENKLITKQPEREMVLC